MGKSFKVLLSTLYHQLISLYDDQHMVKYWRSKGAKIGENVMIYNSNIDRGHIYLIEIGNNVTITNSAVMTHDASMHNFVGKSKIGKVKIGNNVFVGYGSFIMPGVTIGDRVIIGADSVVTKDIPSNSVAAGSPARVIGTLDDYIDRVEKEMEVYPVFDTYWRDKTKEQLDELKAAMEVNRYGYDD